MDQTDYRYLGIGLDEVLFPLPTYLPTYLRPWGLVGQEQTDTEKETERNRQRQKETERQRQTEKDRNRKTDTKIEIHSRARGHDKNVYPTSYHFRPFFFSSRFRIFF